MWKRHSSNNFKILAMSFIQIPTIEHKNVLSSSSRFLWIRRLASCCGWTLFVQHTKQHNNNNNNNNNKANTKSLSLPHITFDILFWSVHYSPWAHHLFVLIEWTYTGLARSRLRTWLMMVATNGTELGASVGACEPRLIWNNVAWLTAARKEFWR